MSKTPIRFILLAPERIVKMPREVEITKTINPRGFEKTRVIIISIERINRERSL